MVLHEAQTDDSSPRNLLIILITSDAEISDVARKTLEGRGVP